MSDVLGGRGQSNIYYGTGRIYHLKTQQHKMSEIRRPIYFNNNVVEGYPRADFNDDALKVHQQLPGYSPTPLVQAPRLATELGVRAVLVKDESSRFGLQSFKILGASWGLYRAVTAHLGLPPTIPWDELAEKARTVPTPPVAVAATDGNHGRAMAYVAKLLSIRCEIYVPRTMDENTQALIEGEGATVHVVQADYDSTVQAAADVSKSIEGGILIQDTSFEGYEQIPAWVVDGYSTMMAEIETQLSAMGLKKTMVVTPVGVGSLAHAVVKHCKAFREPAQVVAVEPDTAACLYRSFHEGQRMTVETTATIMDGLNCGTVSTTAWDDLSQYIDACVTVSCYESHCAVRDLAAEKINSGPCGAASLAALRRLAGAGNRLSLLNKDSVVVLLSTEGSRPYPEPHDVSIDEAIALTQTLTQIDSSNVTLSAAAGAGEARIADYISAWLAHRDIETHRVETVPGRPSVVGVVRGSGGGKSLMLNGHVDTVSLASYDDQPLSGHVSDKHGRPAIFGRGCLDMKSGIAASLATLVAIKKSERTLRGDVIFAAVSDEEDASQGTRDLIKAGWKADGAILPEPTNCAIIPSHKGFLWVEVDILGVAGHGSNPATGVDSILLAGKFLAALAGYQKQLPTDDFLGPASLHCGLIKGGEEPSSYPAKCTITVEFRTIPGQTDDSILQDMQALLAGISKSTPDFKYAEPRAIISRPTQKIPLDHPLIQETTQLATKSLGRAPSIEGASIWCDAALLTQNGTPAIVFGPSGEGLHAKEEWVDIESIQQVSEVLTDLVLKFCQ